MHPAHAAGVHDTLLAQTRDDAADRLQRQPQIIGHLGAGHGQLQFLRGIEAAALALGLVVEKARDPLLGRLASQREDHLQQMVHHRRAHTLNLARDIGESLHELLDRPAIEAAQAGIGQRLGRELVFGRKRQPDEVSLAEKAQDLAAAVGGHAREHHVALDDVVDVRGRVPLENQRAPLRQGKAGRPRSQVSELVVLEAGTQKAVAGRAGQTHHASDTLAGRVRAAGGIRLRGTVSPIGHDRLLIRRRSPGPHSRL